MVGWDTMFNNSKSTPLLLNINGISKNAICPLVCLSETRDCGQAIKETRNCGQAIKELRYHDAFVKC